MFRACLMLSVLGVKVFERDFKSVLVVTMHTRAAFLRGSYKTKRIKKTVRVDRKH